MWFNVVFLILSCFFEIGYSDPIVGGEYVGKKFVQSDGSVLISGTHEFPFKAHLSITEKISKEEFTTITCGGVIISENAILTAAHCLDSTISEPQIYASVGLIDLNYEQDETQVLEVIKNVVHDNYVGQCHLETSEFCSNDIAILWVEEAFEFNNLVKKATLSISTEDLSDKTGWIIGWGANENGKLVKMLKKASMKVISKEECTDIYKDTIISDKMICLISENKKSAPSSGDSGGPFVIGDKVYGIFSVYCIRTKKDGNEVCDPKMPAIYTNVAHYKIWIATQLLLGPRPIALKQPCHLPLYYKSSRRNRI